MGHGKGKRRGAADQAPLLAPSQPPEGAGCTTAPDANVEGGPELINSTNPSLRAGLGEPLRSSG